ncbi:MAG: hypothetical protein ACRC2S_07600 [Waterburya sp.]
MMTNDTEQRILNALDKIDNDLESIKTDIKVIKDDITDLKVTQAKLTTDNGWIKVLFGGAVSMILILPSILITTIFKLLSMLG